MSILIQGDPLRFCPYHFILMMLSLGPEHQAKYNSGQELRWGGRWVLPPSLEAWFIELGAQISGRVLSSHMQESRLEIQPPVTQLQTDTACCPALASPPHPSLRVAL